MLAQTLFALAIAGVLSLAAATVTRTVVVIRHCARSTPSTTGSGDPKYRSFDNYTSHAFPPWPVAPYQCLPHGVKIVQAEGAHLRALGQRPKAPSCGASPRQERRPESDLQAESMEAFLRA